MTLTHLSPHVFTISGLLAPEECATLIALSEERGFEPAGVRTAQGQQALPLVRNNERVVVEAPAWRELVWQRLCRYPLPDVKGLRARGLPRALRFYKYTPGQRFKMHKDGPWTEDGLTSQLTLLVYLNDGFLGGATAFRELSVTPQTGTALLFLHDTWHEGSAVTEGCKYVLRSDVMYDLIA
jgi:predicted 2-oxoglutarate/Fe(II)-dependent dioxygenase YbiX